MRRSQLFIKTRKQAPADEESKNAQLLIRAGFIHKEMAGVYSYLPLGKMVLDNIVEIIRQEMNALGGQEVLLSSLQDKALWELSGRWDDKIVDIWFKTVLKNGGDLGLGWTHEEPLTRIMTQFISSYKDLPVYPYQFQNKMRNELRAKSGLMRAREFVMKDLYSFSKDQAQHDQFYQKITDSYMKVFSRLGIGDITYKTFAGGGAFAKFSHEFQTLSHVGEDTIYLHQRQRLAINQDVLNDEVLTDLGMTREELTEEKAVEVGNIFTLGTRFSEPLNLYFSDEQGASQPVLMGCYGIGPSRLMGLLAEHFADEKGLVWPSAVTPYRIYLASLGEDETVKQAANQVYADLNKAGISVMYDDRDERPGEKFADADLFGIPFRLVVSDKSLQAGGVEIKNRTSTDTQIVPLEHLQETLKTV